MSDSENNKTPQDNDLIEERRKFIRLNINAQINYSVIADDVSARSASVKDIGAGGICLLLDEQLKEGDILKFDVLLPDDPPVIQAKGKVIWIKPFSIASEKKTRYDTGIEFIEISNDDRKKINKYVFSLKIKEL